MWQKVPVNIVLKLMRFWPPYLGAGVVVEKCNKDLTEIIVRMKQTPLNTNYVGVHFGGSLYSMCDPFYMFMLIQQLRDDHIVWDKAAFIDFIRPGKGTVRAHFKLDLKEVEDIKKQALENFSVQPKFECEITDEKGDVVARLEKHLYVRRKDAKKRFSKS